MQKKPLHIGLSQQLLIILQ